MNISRKMASLMFEEKLVGHMILEINGFNHLFFLSEDSARPQKPTESEDECNLVFPRKQTSTLFHSKVN